MQDDRVAPTLPRGTTAQRFCPISTMPTSGLCRPLAQNGLWRRRSQRWSRH